MRNLTLEERFLNGFDALKGKNYEEATQWFLSILFEVDAWDINCFNATDHLIELFGTSQYNYKNKALKFIQLIANEKGGNGEFANCMLFYIDVNVTLA